MTQTTLNNSAPHQNRPVVEEDKRGIRKAQALKANLAKRKQQQRARTFPHPTRTPI